MCSAKIPLLSFEKLAEFKGYQKLIKVSNQNYQIFAAIIKPTKNHFSILLNFSGTKEDVITEERYYCDGMKNGGNLVLERNSIQLLLSKHHGYILLYMQY